VVAILGVDRAPGQQPGIGDRVPAAHGPTHATVTEPAVCAGPDKVVTVFFDSRYRSGYAVLDQSTGQWVDEGIIPRGDYDAIVDLSIGYDTTTGNFVAAALATDFLGEGRHFRNIVTSMYDASSGTWVYGPDDPTPGWRFLDGGMSLDKPWLVAGDSSRPGGQEYYIVYATDYVGPYKYLRSIDGGRHWANGTVQIAEDPNNPEDVVGMFCAQPAVHEDRPLYVAYIPGSGDEIRFLEGQDVDGDPNDPNYDPNDPNYVGVSFSYLCGIWTPLGGPMPPVRAPIRVSLNRGRCDDDLPGNFESKRVPYLAADPSNPNRLYIVYHDTASDDPNDAGYRDVNVYLQKLTKSGSDWILDSRKQVNNDETPFESDQFMPSAVVDDSGYIHVIFYDDRNYNEDADQEDNQTDPPPKFDVFYAYSRDQGEHWDNEELRAPPEEDEPAIDFQYSEEAWLREYIGIAWYGDEEVSQVWTAFNGTSQYEAPNNEGVIWSSFIDWTADPNVPNGP
jgi:hypothetical protein